MITRDEWFQAMNPAEVKTLADCPNLDFVLGLANIVVGYIEDRRTQKIQSLHSWADIVGEWRDGPCPWLQQHPQRKKRNGAHVWTRRLQSA